MCIRYFTIPELMDALEIKHPAWTFEQCKSCAWRISDHFNF